MGTNSKRERIIQDVYDVVSGISSISTVRRELPSFEDLQVAALTQLPMASITGGLPVPVDPNFSGRNAKGRTVVFKSQLNVKVAVHGQQNGNADTEISNIADDLWQALYVDPSRDGLAIQTLINPEMDVEVFCPYYGFMFNCVITYVHTMESI